jgi:hypothetical protein
MAGKLSHLAKIVCMKLKYLLAALMLAAAVACNNEASVQDKSDSVTQTSDQNQSTWPEPGKDSISSPSTQSDTSHLKSH